MIEAVGSYTELLPTGTGVRVLLLGVLPAHGRKKGNYETYQTGRFIAVTGRRLFGTSVAVEHRQDALLRVHGWFFGGRWWRSAEAVAPPPAECDAVAPDDGPWGNGDRAAWPFSVIDARLQRRLGPWPRRVGSRLFAFGPDGALLWLHDPEALFIWIGRCLGERGQPAPRWQDGPGWFSRADYFRHLQQFATPCAAAEPAPTVARENRAV